ncbi:hypothetical protein [Glaciimonas sp. PCH181]|uniref:hypothetical protein n=1 Tax=Glaciimonas sp. PCH181 TaxID=2133943 RepID=UPI000D3845CF|nr:hypothetical protein [Glaciimonas sp. PCH181]PUA18136.1 hypothetical protein C7W93_20145 [Glaciimonas sp. PCH181]
MRAIHIFLSRCLPTALALLAMSALSAPANAQQLQTKFSCNVTRDEGGEKVIYSDGGEINLDGNKVQAFRWESDQYRPTHGFDCSVDESDEPVAEVLEGSDKDSWRVSLKDPVAARARRGFDFYNHGKNCSIRLQRDGDTLHIEPTCPALCGSRPNFTTLSVNVKTGTCLYEDK